MSDDVKQKYEDVFYNLDWKKELAEYIRNQMKYEGVFVKLYGPNDPLPPPPIGWSGLPK